jgi:predicted nucleic acid-binding protein
MPAVSDTSPILGLSVIGYLSLLHEQFGDIFIPQAVFDELRIESNFRGVSSIQEAIETGWLQTKQIKNKPLAQSLSNDLNIGEAEAITLAVDLNIEMIVMDERIGRERARDLGLKTVGVLGILLTAKKQKQISSIKNVMDDLRKEIGFFISEELYHRVLKQAGE